MAQYSVTSTTTGTQNNFSFRRAENYVSANKDADSGEIDQQKRNHAPYSGIYPVGEGLACRLSQMK
jgi:hypothetical protein